MWSCVFDLHGKKKFRNKVKLVDVPIRDRKASVGDASFGIEEPPEERGLARTAMFNRWGKTIQVLSEEIVEQHTRRLGLPGAGLFLPLHSRRTSSKNHGEAPREFLGEFFVCHTQFYFVVVVAHAH